MYDKEQIVIFPGVNTIGTLGGLNNMANLASMTPLPSNHVSNMANPAAVAVAAAPGNHPNIISAGNTTVAPLNRQQPTLNGSPNISAEQWQSAYSGVQQFVGKAVFHTNVQVLTAALSSV